MVPKLPSDICSTVITVSMSPAACAASSNALPVTYTLSISAPVTKRAMSQSCDVMSRKMPPDCASDADCRAEMVRACTCPMRPHPITPTPTVPSGEADARGTRRAGDVGEMREDGRREGSAGVKRDADGAAAGAKALTKAVMSEGGDGGGRGAEVVAEWGGWGGGGDGRMYVEAGGRC
ncbi:unnamed protein product [Chondrus crispus]|uniref:Uncharacterized protein n=1 Tax=Chondrus crispus TaxID=2769 RepID=R7QKQ4_CHOCR|nr:unnamed protein product [Chondrus crispus]CDF39097.1 unnamed protein product [Chondrus crispus]|eukprot:XP_005719008.1 unnamed protein product [Chondrus crispus]